MTEPRRRPVVAGLVCVVVSLLIGATVAVHGFLTDTRPVTVGAHSGRVGPTTDGWATLDLGGLLPAVRVHAGLPLSLGVRLDLTSTEVETAEAVVRNDALIASAPEGEIAKVQSALVEMAWVHAARGAGVAVLCGLVLTYGWRRAGPQARSRWLAGLTRAVRRPRSVLRRPRLRTVGVTALVCAAVTGLLLPIASHESPPRPPWVPLAELFPEVSSVPELEGVQIADSAETRGAATLIQGAIEAYRASLVFYSDLTDAVPRIADQLHQPSDDETVALLVSDRHDNIGMDDTVAALARAGGASVLVDAGDDTSSGAQWETFSIDSLAEAAERAGDLKVVAVPGNHDFGDTIEERMSDLDFTVLDGEPVEVAGITFLGDADPRASAYTPTRVQGEETIEQQADRLADVACEDGDVSTVVVHDPNSGYESARRGCVDLVLSGHLHRQVGPDRVEGTNGHVATTFTNGTTGGAAYAIALGSKLRRPAQLTLVTYRDGEPVGLQPVDVTTGGTIEVQDYTELPPSVAVEGSS